MKSQNNFKKLSVTLLLLAMLVLAPAAMAASISTDQEDYAPWEIVTINGSGFDPNSAITLTMEWPDGWVDEFYDTSDESGGFISTYAKEKYEGTFTVTATDGTNTATTTFTDAASMHVSLAGVRYASFPSRRIFPNVEKPDTLSFTLNIKVTGLTGTGNPSVAWKLRYATTTGEDPRDNALLSVLGVTTGLPATGTYTKGDPDTLVTISIATGSLTLGTTYVGHLIGERTAGESAGSDHFYFQLMVTEPAGLPNMAPTANAGGPYSVTEGSSVILSGAASCDPNPEDSIVLFEWDFNYDGTFYVDATGASPTFSAAGIVGPSSRTVALRVTDNHGAASAIDTETVSILVPADNTPPEVVSIGVSDDIISEADCGAPLFFMVIKFSELMDTSVAPVITFTPDVASTLAYTLAFAGGSWLSDGKTYRPVYNVYDADVEIVPSIVPPGAVDVTVSGAKDLVGNTMDPATEEDLFVIDTIAPKVTAKASPAPNDNDNGWNNTDVTVSYIATDGWGIDEETSDLSDDVLSEGAGQSASGTAVDLAGNSSTATVIEINIDKTLPKGNITINNDALYTKTINVILNLDATDAVGVTGYRIANGADASGGTVVDVPSTTHFTDDIDWDLPAGDGTKTVAVQYRDVAGNWSANSTDDILLDTTPPETTCSPSGTEGNNDWYTSNVIVSLTAQDLSSSEGVPVSGVAAIYYSLDEQDPVEVLDDEVTLTIDTEGIHTLEYWAVDNAGNEETPHSQSQEIKIDKTPPTLTWGAITPAPNAAGWNNSVPVTIPIIVTDAISQPASTNPTKVSFNDEGQNQTQSVTVYDNAGHSTTSPSPAVNIDWTPPTITASISPASPAPSGWYNISTGAPTVIFTCGDTGGSGLASSCPAAVTLGNGAAQSVSGGPVLDVAGNSSGVATISGIDVDLIAPTITASISPASPAPSGWYNISTGAPTVSFTCGDTGGSGLSSSCPAAVTLGNGAAQSVSGGPVFDVAGNSSGVATISGINIDTTPPTISGAATTSPNSNGWYKTNVTIHFTASDIGGSGIASLTPDVTVSTEGSGQSVTGTAVDVAGNSESFTVGSINIDKTAPVVTATASPSANAAGWNNTDVKVTFSATDIGGSGVATVSPPVTVTTEGAGQVITGSATDVAGNPASASVTLNIDKTPPVVTIIVPVEGAYYRQTQVVSANWTATDALSKIDLAHTSGTVPSGSPIPTGTVGAKTFTVDATDNAGNTTTKTVTYNVWCYTFIGFLPPVDNLPTFNVGKAGRTFPIKWQLKDYNGNFVSDLISVVKLTYRQIATDTSSPQDTIPDTSGASGLRYDSASNQYIFNWQTSSTFAGKSYEFVLTLNDGTEHIARFRFTK